MNKIIKKLRDAVQVLLLAPIKLPAKAMEILRYVAVGLGILESVTKEENEAEAPDNEEGGGGDAAAE